MLARSHVAGAYPTARLISATLRSAPTLPGDAAKLRGVRFTDLITLMTTLYRAEGWVVAAADTLRSHQFVLKAFLLRRKE